ncbi:U32 family peptidase [Caldanaerobius polysaccharolyticus]|uniref:U32 family peptidase n=1 Tax=Caldanaerobius polysaccharolyticus TaxID=44256 RepID=UPI00047A9056|nr:U32 family peptidase [Caldanaerobius polysaccharolyticus]
MNVELLAPAGDWEALVAAVQNGADAVYAGGRAFSARAYARNFDRDELKKAIDYCHLYGKKLYITVNTVVDDYELKEMVSYAADLYEMGADAFIVQDLGAARVMIDMGLPVHASTQMNVHNAKGVKFLQDMGFKRVVLARELSLKEIQDIVAKTSMEIEVFVHGALCVSYSGLCLMSSLIGGRSGNRGKCAQPCRKLYQLVDASGNAVGEKGYLMSMKDLNTVERLKDIVQAGVTSLKIEGRMKRPEYVATVVKAYRSALDGVLTLQDVKDLKAIFSRDFTPGYILGEQGPSVVNTHSPNNQGVCIGRLLSVKKGVGTFEFDVPVSLGDGIRIGDVGFTVSAIYKNGEKVQEASGRVQIPVKEVKPGDVYRTSDVKLIQKARMSYQDIYSRKIPVEVYGEVHLGCPMKLKLWDGTNAVETKGSVNAERAIKKSLDPDRVKEQLCKTGGTPYRVEHIQVDVDEGVMLPVKEINSVRRSALEKLTELRCYTGPRPMKKPEYAVAKRPLENEIRLYAKVLSAADGSQAIKGGIDGVYVQSVNIDELLTAWDECRSKEVEFIWALPYITREKTMDEVLKLAEKLACEGIDRVAVSNLGLVQPLHDIGYTLHGDHTLNVFNSQSVFSLREHGVKVIALSPELRLSQIKDIVDIAGGGLEVVAYGYIPAMITAYDPVKKALLLKGILADAEGYGIRDETGVVFPVKRHSYTIVYNSRPIFMADRISDVVDAGVKNLRLDFIGNGEDICCIVECYRSCLEGDCENAREIREHIGKFTRGHFYKGVE